MASVRRRLLALSALVVISLVAVACGDDDETSATANLPSDTAESSDAADASNGPGVTDSTIKLGFAVDDLENANAVAEGLGGADDAYTESEVQKKLQAVIDYINDEGGIGGRMVEPVWHYEDASSVETATGRQQEAQRACAAWTEDDQVFAFAVGSGEDLMRECAVKAKTVMVAEDTTSSPTPETFESIAPYWYAPNLLIAERRERALAETLLADEFFTPDAKVGILIEDDPATRAAVEEGMKPILEDAGVDVVAEAVYPDPIDSPWSTYVLQFQSAGVTHLVMSGTAYLFAPSLFMMGASESQEFRPYWGLASDQDPNQLVNIGAPQTQLARTQGMGWIPSNDVPLTEEVSAQEELCVQILTDAGRPSGPGDGGFCEFLFFLQQALDGADVINADVLAEAVHELDTDYVSTITMDGDTRFGPEKHDGPSTMRPFAFNEACGEEGAGCFEYTGAAQPIPE